MPDKQHELLEDSSRLTLKAGALHNAEDMIARLVGKVVDLSGNVVVLDAAGVGYEVACTSDCVSKLVLGESAELVIYTEVREDNIRLFGFEDKLEKQTFLLLTRVKGVGARTASEIISRVNKKELLRLISAGDLTTLQSIKGIGKKTAERIVVELKDKVGDFALEGQAERMGIERINVPFQDAIDALTALGFTQFEAEEAISQAKGALPGLAELPAGELVREALKYV